ATDNTDHFPTWSNYGATSVDLAAPGVNIYSTVPGGYGTKSGTSMAAPHVTGAAALVWAANPGLTMTEVRNRLLAGTDPIGSLNRPGPTVPTGGRTGANAILKGPGVSVPDATVPEGNWGPTTATFTVTLSAQSGQTVTVAFATADGTATAASGDYQATNGTV